MSYTHLLHKFNKKLGKKISTQVLPTPPVQSPQGLVNPVTQGTGATGNSLTFSRSSLEAKIATFECMSTDPNDAPVADAICQLLLN